MKRVAIYMRVSTDKQAQEGDSIAAQRDALTKYVKDHGYILTGEYLDDGISGTKNDRDELQRMLSDVQAGKIDLILTTKMDRLHRSLRNFLNMQDLLDRCHCDWLAIWEPMYDSSTPQGRMIINTMMNLAQFEAEQTGQRIRQVFAYKKSSGEVLSGSVPLGFSIVDKRLVPNEHADKILSVFEYYANTGKMFETCRYLADLGFPRTPQTVKHLLSNTRYCGTIVPEDIFDDVQRKLSMNVKASQKHTYLFSGLVCCAECGKKFSGIPHMKKYAYRCKYYYDRVQKKCSNSKMLYEHILERYLLQNLIPMLTDYIAKQEEQEKPKDNTKRIKSLEKKLDRLKDLYLNDLITMDELKAEREKILTEIASLQTVAKRDLSAHKAILEMDVENYYASLTEEQKRGFWRSIIDHITFDKDRRITVYFL